MNELQLVLLIIAVAAVAGIYWHARRRGSQQAVWRDDPKEKQITLFGDEEENLVGRPRPAGEKQAPTMDSSAISAMPPGVLTVCIHQTQAQPLPAAELHRSLEAAGLRYGEHGYYHKSAADSSNIYSVGAITKPGTLDPADGDDLATPGLIFYLELDVLGDRAPVVLEDVLTTAESLCATFDAELVDGQRAPLTVEGLEALRERVRGKALG